MGAKVHPSSVIDPAAELADGVEIGPNCTITGKVKLAERVQLIGAVHIYGPVEIGPGSTFYPGACIGYPGQDYKFKLGMPTAGVKIGAECLIREHVTIHAATKPDVPTTLGNRVFMMVSSHAGHDARIDDDAILVNSAVMGGHSHVATRAIMSGNTSLHQFARVGRLAFIGGGVACPRDVPPFCVAGIRDRINGVNFVGMRRAGMDRDEITNIRRAFWEVLRTNLPRQEAVARLRELGKNSPAVLEMAEFLNTSKRGCSMGMGAGHHDEVEIV